MNPVIILCAVSVIILSWVGGGPIPTFSEKYAANVLEMKWGMGGGYYWAPYYLAGAGLLLAVVSLARGKSSSGRSRSLWIFSPWLLLLILPLAGLSNPGVAILDASSYPLAVEANDGFNPWLPSSVDPGRTAAFLLTGGGLLLTFVGVFYGGLRQGEMIAFCVVAYVNSLVLALAGIFQKALGSDTMLGIWEPMNPSFFATFAYKNHWVGFATLSLFCGVAWFLSRHQSPGTKNDPRVFVGFTLPILLLTLPMSGSRAGVVLLLLMMVLLLGSLRGRSMASRVGTVLFILGLAGLVPISICCPSI